MSFNFYYYFDEIKIVKSKVKSRWVILSDDENFIWTASIRINNDRTQSDQTDCHLSQVDIPENLGYAFKDQQYLYFAGGLNEEFKVI